MNVVTRLREFTNRYLQFACMMILGSSDNLVMYYDGRKLDMGKGKNKNPISIKTSTAAEVDKADEERTKKEYQGALLKIIKESLVAIIISPIIVTAIMFIILALSKIDIIKIVFHRTSLTPLLVGRLTAQFLYELIIKAEAIIVGLLAFEFMYYQSVQNQEYIDKNKRWKLWVRYCVLYGLIVYIYFDKLITP